MHSRSTNSKTSGPTTGGGSIFANFETVQLSTEERLLLHAARLGDNRLVQELLENSDTSSNLNINCVDYMGRNALFLAVDSENVEIIEILLERVSWESIEDALLHAISKGARNIVEILVDHPTYQAHDQSVEVAGPRDPFFRTEEKYQYPPDITPLILAAHMNDHELVQLFLARGATIPHPHPINCKCEDCSIKQETDSLRRSRSRMNRYKALASPAYMALSSPDPITTTFELRQEMKKVAQVEKEFKSEYLCLVEQCMDFACELMDLCRGTQEVEAVLGEESARDPLARLRLAIEYDEKKFVAHPNCQQHLTKVWFGNEMAFLQTWPLPKKLGLGMIAIPCLPFLCLGYIFTSNCKLFSALRCPVTKFITHTVSHFVFLILLAVATFGLEEIFTSQGTEDRDEAEEPGITEQLVIQRPHSLLRPHRGFITQVQLLLVFWIVGLLWIECKQIYTTGAREHFMQSYNYMDFTILALYLASYTLRFVAQFRVKQADYYFNATHRADAVEGKNYTDFISKLKKEVNSPENYTYGYFMWASRFEWEPSDPEIVSEILFAVANLLSFARTTYVMPSHELLGPLQISLGRMLGDITRFVVLFLLVLLAFMVGMTNLYRYYGTHIISQQTSKTASDTFKGLPETVHTLFFSIFGLIPLDLLKINAPDKLSLEGRKDHFSTALVDRVGMVMFAVYQVSVTIVLVNILIAMMSHSFEAIQIDNDVEWKFARTKLWLNYIDEGSTLPVPFNMIPTPKSFWYGWLWVKDGFTEHCTNVFKDRASELQAVKYDFTRRRENVQLPDAEALTSLIQKQTTYSEILQRLVRRYLFKMEREKMDKLEGGALRGDDYSDGTEAEASKEAEKPPEVQEPTDEPAEEEPPHTDEEKPSDEEQEEEGMQSPRRSKPIKQLTIISEGEGDPEEPVAVLVAVPLAVPPPSPALVKKDSTSPKRQRKRRVGDRSPLGVSFTPGANEDTAVPRSSSSEAIRQMTRRATMRKSRGPRWGSQGSTHPPSHGQGGNITSGQLDAIQRFQRVLDARLQDLQVSRHEETVLRGDVQHMRHLLGEHQKAIGSLVNAMEIIQDEIRNLSLRINNHCRRTPSASSAKGSQGRGGKIAALKMSLKKRRSDGPTSV